MMSETMNLTLRVWRQDNAEETGRFEEYEAIDISPDISMVGYTYLI